MNNNISSDIVGKCICRYNNFKLCFRNTNNNEYCRYHKNTKNGYIYKIFYDEEKLIFTFQEFKFSFKKIFRMPLPFQSFSNFLRQYCIYAVFSKTE